MLEGAAGSPHFQGELMLVRYFGLVLLYTQKEVSYVSQDASNDPPHGLI